jgi:hypothetical protein
MSDHGQVVNGGKDGASPRRTRWPVIVLAWTFVGVPWAWGVSQTLVKSMALFKGGEAGGAAGVATQPSTRPVFGPASR